MYWFAKTYLRLRGWRIDGAFPPDPKFVVIGAPHTSNVDFLVFLGVLGHFNRRAHFIGKSSLFWGPLGWLMRKLGGIPVRRDSAGGLVEQAVAAIDEADEMILVIAPEGTRSKADMWKSGFYRIAGEAGIPILPASVNGVDRVVTVGALLPVTHDINADMHLIRSFFLGVEGIRPGNETPILLSEETATD